MAKVVMVENVTAEDIAEYVRRAELIEFATKEKD